MVCKSGKGLAKASSSRLRSSQPNCCCSCVDLTAVKSDFYNEKHGSGIFFIIIIAALDQRSEEGYVSEVFQGASLYLLTDKTK